MEEHAKNNDGMKMKTHILPHPTYSLDLAPCIFRIFSELACRFQCRQFLFAVEVISASQAELKGRAGNVWMNFTNEILTTARDLELEVNEDDIEELIMGHENELTIDLQETLNEEHQEAQQNVSPSEQEEDERGPMLTSAIKDLLKKWERCAIVLEWHPNQADLSRVGDLYNDNAINYFRKIRKKREKQSTLDMFFNAP
ncbi:uncharacterized protein TNCV_4244021 [Trichonephila clavipes]|nr:uncharacterized protein TNCV_4244021 [Trichonephila clavipes]